MVARLALCCILCCAPLLAVAQRGVFLSEQRFFHEAFGEGTPQWQTLWINKQYREEIEGILNRSFPALRIRYMGSENKTAWIFEEIGKELPITIGVVVNKGRVEKAAVLEYRETRGGEIRHPFFTSQFEGVALVPNTHKDLDQSIDGVTGATLSVRAMTRVVRAALYCHQLTPFHQ